MARFNRLKAALRQWLTEAVAELRESRPDLYRGLPEWGRDPDGIVRKRRRERPIWRHDDVERVRSLPSWGEVKLSLQEDAYLKSQLDTSIGSMGNSSRFDEERLVHMILPNPDELGDIEGAFEGRYTRVERLLASEELEELAILPLPGLMSPQFPIRLEDAVQLDVMSDAELCAALDAGVLRPRWSRVDMLTQAEATSVACLRLCRRLPKIIGDGDSAGQSATRDEGVDSVDAVRETFEMVCALLSRRPVIPTGCVVSGDDWMGGQLSTAYAVPTGGHRRQLQLEQSMIQRLVDTWQALRRTDALVRHKEIGVALRRLRFQTHRENIEDELIDLMIAAEALYLSDTEQQELGLRLALRSATFSNPVSLGATRRQVFDLMKTAYGVRGKLVHGKEPPVSSWRLKGEVVSRTKFVEAVGAVVRQGVENAIALGVRDAWPPDWDDLILPGS